MARSARCLVPLNTRFLPALVIAATLWLSTAVSAESIPLVPDPITTPELMKYADLVGLSDRPETQPARRPRCLRSSAAASPGSRCEEARRCGLWNLATTFIKAGMAGTVQLRRAADFEALIEQYKK